MSGVSLLFSLLACGPGLAPPPAPAPVHVDLSADARAVPAGQEPVLTVEVGLAAGWSLELKPPEAAGFAIEPMDASGPTLDRGRSTRTQRFRVQGGPGSAVVRIPAAVATGPGGESLAVEVAPLFLDVGVTGPSGGLDQKLALAPPAEGPPWALIGGISAAAALALGLAVVVARRRRVGVPVAPLRPEDQARRAWAAARAAGLDDHALAFALSDVLRRFLEQISGWPATAATPREITAWLAEVGLVDATVRPRAARVLDATERLKFARDGGGADFFDALESDLFAVLDAASAPPPPPPTVPDPPRPVPVPASRRPPTTAGVPQPGAAGGEDADRDPPTDGGPPWGSP